MSQSILIQKSLEFSAQIIKLQQYLIKEKRETIISKQIIRSATSIGANINEAFIISLILSLTLNVALTAVLYKNWVDKQLHK